MKKSTLQLVCFVLLSILSNKAAAADKYLLPYRKGSSWGLSDEKGTIIIPCKYESVTYIYPYAFAVEKGESGTTRIFDKTGKFIDSCLTYIPLCNNRFFIVKPSRQILAGLFRVKADNQNTMEGAKMGNLVGWTKFDEPCSGYILESGNVKKATPGTFNSVAPDQFIAGVEMNGKCGLYNFSDDSFLIKPAYNSMVYISPFWVLALKDGDSTALFGCNGKKHPGHPDSTALYIDGNTGNYVLKVALTHDAKYNFSTYGYRLISGNGQELIAADRDWQFWPTAYAPEFILLRKPKDSLKYGQSVFRMLGLDGQVIFPSVNEVVSFSDDVVRILDISPEGMGEFLYNTKLKKVLFPENAGKVPLVKSSRIPVIRKNKQHLYYNDKGELLAAVPDSVLNWQKEQLFMQQIELQRKRADFLATGVHQNIYFAIRADAYDHYTIYNDTFQKIGGIFDAFTEIATGSYISFRRGEKWGVIDEYFKEVVPPVYDAALTFTDHYAYGLVDGHKKRIDLQNGRTIDNAVFDDFGFSSFGAKYLAARYVQTRGSRGYYDNMNRVATLYITDSLGKIQDSLPQNDVYSYKYVFTSNGSILKYSDGDERAGTMYVLEGKKGIAKTCPYPFGKPELCNGKALLIQCRNDKGEIALISANDFGFVVPFGKYQTLGTQYYPIATMYNSGPVYEALEITGQPYQKEKEEKSPYDPFQAMKAKMDNSFDNDDNETIGLYSVDGRKFWDKP